MRINPRKIGQQTLPTRLAPNNARIRITPVQHDCLTLPNALSHSSRSHVTETKNQQLFASYPEAMPNRHPGLYLLVLVGLGCAWFCIRKLRLLWRELTDYMLNQRSGD